MQSMTYLQLQKSDWIIHFFSSCFWDYKHLYLFISKEERQRLGSDSLKYLPHEPEDLNLITSLSNAHPKSWVQTASSAYNPITEEVEMGDMTEKVNK